MHQFKNRGQQVESQASLYYHNKYRALLIDSALLRDRGAGQVDVAYVVEDLKHREKVGCLVEVKSSPWISRPQQSRMRKSAILISAMLKMSIRIECYFWRSLEEMGGQK